MAFRQPAAALIRTGLEAKGCDAYPIRMVIDPAERIENALARIEAASAAGAFSIERLRLRNKKLRVQIEEAISSLDELITREPEQDPE